MRDFHRKIYHDVQWSVSDLNLTLKMIW